jgi:patatin-like phospholipase/acyl hydrolase
MKKILSIDGGGIRGIIPATILAQIEKQTGRPIAETFDLIAGTSTGGILALALSKAAESGKAQYSAEELIDLYAEHGDEIFHRSAWRRISTLRGLSDERYGHEALENLLRQYMGDEVLGNALTHVLVSTYDIENRQPFFFKSWRDESKQVEMWQAARATSAAPTYFEPALVRVVNDDLALVDGGVYINNPAVSAFAEARRLYQDEAEFLVLSLGTGELTRPIPYEAAKGWGLAAWAIPILSVVLDGVSRAVDYQMRQMLGDNYYRYQVELTTASDDMDNASRANIEALKRQSAELVAQKEEDLQGLYTKLAG